MRAIIFLLIVILVPFTVGEVNGQDIRLLDIEKRSFEEGLKFYEEGFFHQAKSVFESMAEEPENLNTASCSNCALRSLFYIAECKFYLEEYDSEAYLLNLIREHRDAPIVNTTIFRIANYYFEKEDFVRARSFYNMIDRPSVTNEVRAIADFNSGYISFQEGDYADARNLLIRVPDDHPRSDDARFYLALSNMELGDLSEAEELLRGLKSEKYKKQIPYYIARIKVKTDTRSELVDYLDPIVEKGSNYEHFQDLLRIYGEALYDLKRYQEAAENLDKYCQISVDPEREAVYKLGYSYLKTENCESAVRSFNQLLNTEDELLQPTLFNLAHCFLILEDRSSARTAFLKASLRDDDAEIKYESLYQYALLNKLEGSYDEALSAFGEIPEYHPKYKEAIKHIADIIAESKQYDKALTILNGIDEWTLELKEAYQKLSFHKGLSHLDQNESKAADESFSRSLQYPLDELTRVQALYWKADVAHTLGKYGISNQHLEEFFLRSKKVAELPEGLSLLAAYYLQGYNYLKLGDYILAIPAFKKVLKHAPDKIKEDDPFTRSLVYDATLRIGDCYLKKNSYAEALQYYDSAINENYKGYEHAMFYKAIILGLKGDNEGKLAMLDNFSLQHPDHELADDAIFEMGETFLAIKRFEQAKGAYLHLINDYASYSGYVTMALLRLGLISYNEGDHDKALYYYRDVFDHNPSPSEIEEVLNNVQEIYIQDLNNADGYFDFIADLPGYDMDKTGMDSLSFVAANVSYMNRKFAIAAESFNVYIKKYPKGLYRTEALYKLGDSYYHLENYQQSLEAFELIVKAGPGPFFIESLERAAHILYVEMHEYDRALEFYEKYFLSLNNEDKRHDALLFCMKSAYKAGNSQKLKEYSREVLVNSRSNNKDRALANYYRGKEAFDSNDFPAALNYLNKVTDLTDGMEAAESRYLIAKMYYIKKELEIADRLCQYGIRENANYPYWIAKCMILQSDISLSMGDTFKAGAVLEAIIENYKPEDDGIIEEARNKLQIVNARGNGE